MAEQDHKPDQGGWKALRVPWIRRLLIIGLGIAAVQQLTGMNSIMCFDTQILTDSGFNTEAALVGNIANGVISVAATFVGIWLLGRAGRRPMLFVGILGTTLSLFMNGLMSMLLPVGMARALVLLILTVTFLAF